MRFIRLEMFLFPSCYLASASPHKDALKMMIRLKARPESLVFQSFTLTQLAVNGFITAMMV